MLILSRRTSERIFIDDDIIISVEAVKGNQVRIGIEAPQRYKILREEVWEKENAPRKLPRPPYKQPIC